VKIVLTILSACLLLMLLVMFRGGPANEIPPAPAKPAAMEPPPKPWGDQPGWGQVVGDTYCAISRDGYRALDRAQQTGDFASVADLAARGELIQLKAGTEIYVESPSTYALDVEVQSGSWTGMKCSLHPDSVTQTRVKGRYEYGAGYGSPAQHD